MGVEIRYDLAAQRVVARVSNPLSIDSDCDGLVDGPLDDAGLPPGLSADQVAFIRKERPVNGKTFRLVEDWNKDGQRASRTDGGKVVYLETDPANPDSDGDGLTDGLELGIGAGMVDGVEVLELLEAIWAQSPNCADASADASKWDADPSSYTDPTDPDTDGDGITDSAEDDDLNGQVNGGELDPNIPNEGGIYQLVCGNQGDCAQECGDLERCVAGSCEGDIKGAGPEGV